MLIGGFADRHAAGWNDAQITWYEELLEEQDVDIMGWAIGRQPPPARFEGELMRALQALDYIKHPE